MPLFQKIKKIFSINRTEVDQWRIDNNKSGFHNPPPAFFGVTKPAPPPRPPKPITSK